MGHERNTADVLIVGAGFFGLATAWALLVRDTTLRVMVLDAGDFASGGSGRNGSGFRLQWSREFNIQLVVDSLEVFRNGEDLLGYRGGLDVKHQGYLMLAHSAAALESLQQAVDLQQILGVPSQILSADECLKVQPGLNLSGLRGASYCWKDGTLSPFKWLDALYGFVRRAGGVVKFQTSVSSVTSLPSSFLVTANEEQYHAKKVVICTDWAAPELLSPLAVNLPIRRAAKEALITGATRPMVRTVLMSGMVGLGIKQLDRGNIIITLSRSTNCPNGELDSPRPWLSECCRKATNLLPSLSEVSVLRQWNGYISRTPDMQPVLGRTEIDNLYVAVSAYKGLMISPQVGRIMADIILDGHSTHVAAGALSASRFKADALVPETLTI
ncbi:MAG: NAD(P)/FAD-dependent oxidoreductase [Parvibaculaceae bacterium]